MADYDGDGLEDLVSGSTCCQRPSPFCFYVFPRLPGGVFGARQKINLRLLPEEFEAFEFPFKGIRSKVAIADWNGDGNSDVLIGGHPKILCVAYGPLVGKDELPMHRVWPKGEEPLDWITTNPCVADWDGEGRDDLIVGNKTDQGYGVYWLRNVGKKGMTKLGPPRLLVADSDVLRTTGLCVSDWNQDGRADLITSRREYEIKEGEARSRRKLRHHKVWVYLRRSR